MEITGKTALVTGGAHRVGKSIALMLAGRGANVVVNYHRSAEAAEQTVAEIEARGVQALALQADVAELEQVEAMARAALARFQSVDIVVNSADLLEQTPFPMEDVEVWRRVTQVAIDGAFYVCNALAPAMLARGHGVIVNLVDLSAFLPWPRFTAHAVAKAGLLALTRQLALELAPTVRVNAVAPGPVLPSPHHDEARIAASARKTLLQRVGSPEDVAHAVRYLIEAEYVTGEVMMVDGGESIAYYKRLRGEK
jgi:NAD(P)-dependent dehydrogenase (short-subunit alcohol dehydrogenase family)